MHILNWRLLTKVYSREGTANSSGAPEFTHGFCVVRGA